MVVSTAFEKAEELKEIIGTDPPLDVDETVWSKIWPRLQTNDMGMWSWDYGIPLSHKYLDHMFASERLADCFERGLPIDESLYVEIVR